jgi:hypothetical protein
MTIQIICDSCSHIEKFLKGKTSISQLIDRGWDIDEHDQTYHICDKCMEIPRKLEMIRNSSRDLLLSQNEEREEREFQKRLSNMTFVEEIDNSDQQPIAIIDEDDFEGKGNYFDSNVTVSYAEGELKAIPVWQCEAINCNFWLTNSMENLAKMEEHERHNHIGLKRRHVRGFKCRYCNFVDYMENYNGKDDNSIRSQVGASLRTHELVKHQKSPLKYRNRRQKINRKISFRRVAQL